MRMFGLCFPLICLPDIKLRHNIPGSYQDVPRCCGGFFLLSGDQIASPNNDNIDKLINQSTNSQFTLLPFPKKLCVAKS